MLANSLTHADLCGRLEREIVARGSLSKLAEALAISPQYLSDVLGNKRGVGRKLQRALRVRRRIVRVVTYVPE